jgi:hypothetical protein
MTPTGGFMMDKHGSWFPYDSVSFVFEAQAEVYIVE